LLQDQATAAFQCFPLGFCVPTNRSWVPVERRLVGQLPTQVTGPQQPGLLPDGIALKAGVDATGGGWHQTMLLTEPSLTGTFREVFDDFRSSYVLRYTPQGVTRGGWHTIDVTVPRAKGASVRARKGYGIDDTVPTPAPAPPRTVPAVPRTLTDFTAAYERGAYQSVTAGLRVAENPERLIRDLTAAGNPWPSTPRREAAFVVELADAGLFASAPDARKSAEELLTRHARLVRHPLAPDEFERQWYVAVLAMLQGAIRPEVAQPLVDRAIARFPGEPRFVLARAIVSDQRLSSGAAKPAAPYEETTKAYEAAIAHPEVATEARVRLGHRLHLQGRHDAALEHLLLAAAGSKVDGTLGYLRQLFLGRVYAALNRRDDAVAAYRAALEIVPPGQAARVALMSQLLLGGALPDAIMLADIVQTEQSPVYDPWWMYWQGQYRHYAQAMARLREYVAAGLQPRGPRQRRAEARRLRRDCGNT
jgi:tetratricopeptide (TPR) repeat protein